MAKRQGRRSRRHHPNIPELLGFRIMQVTSAVPPAPPWGAPDLAWLQAWIDAVRDGRDPVAAVESRVNEILARQLGRAQLKDLWWSIPERLRPLFGLPEGEGVRQLLGHYDRNGSYVPGLAGLTEREFEVFNLHIHGWSDSAIQAELTPPGLLYDRSRWVSLKTIYNHLSRARQKVRALFDLDRWGPDLGA